MTIDELINKYNDELILLEEKRKFWKDKDNYSFMGSCDDKIDCYYKIIQDLKKLKEKGDK